MRYLYLAAYNGPGIKPAGARLDPGPSFSMMLAFAVPVIAEQAEITAEACPDEWRTVRLGRGSPRYLDNSGCELVEQFNEQVMSILNVRAIED